MTSTSRFPQSELAALEKAKGIGVRSGTEHRYTGVWVVVVAGRVYVRSWNNKPTGWFRAFGNEPQGSIKVGSTEIAVRALPVRSGRVRQAVTEAFARKYDTKASEKWVQGFAEPEREATTLEIVPR